MSLKLDAAAVKAEAERQRLLTEPDPLLASLEVLQITEENWRESYLAASASEWIAACQPGANDFSDEYAIRHGGKAPKSEDLVAISKYLYVNRLWPAEIENFKVAWLRLNSAGIIVEELADMLKNMPTEPERKLTLAELSKKIAKEMESINDNTREGRKKMDELRKRYTIIESRPVYDSWYADLQDRGVSLSEDEQKRMFEWLEQRPTLLLNLRKSYDVALKNLFPQYLSAEQKALRELDRDDITSADLKRVLGTAPSARIGYADKFGDTPFGGW
jgi:hypothetical protein